MSDIVAVLNQNPEYDPMVRAAMAHLNLVMVHPFRDGIGRMARCLQSLVLARRGTVTDAFMSIEEYLGRNTLAYYDVLARVGGGKWQPDRDTRPWLRFVLTAHLRQARTHLRRVREGERLWLIMERQTQAKGLPERCLPPLYNAATGIGIRNATYRASVLAESDDEITEATASRDLRELVAAGFLVPRGEKRGRTYIASAALSELRRAAAEQSGVPRDDPDPFA
jgi:Fic family protein